MRQKILAPLICSLSLLAPAVQAEQDAALLAYQVFEEGLEPYFSRILVTPGHMRMDEGDGSAGYTLYDRKQGVIYNVSHEDRSILVIDSEMQIPTKPAELKLSEKTEVDAKAPTIGGKQPQNVRIYANDKLCLELVAVPGLMSDALAALSEFRLLLARVQSETLANMPADTQSPCDLAQYIYAADRVYAFGLPVQESRDGRSQSLLDFSDRHSVDEKLFALPADYQRLEMPGSIGSQ